MTRQESLALPIGVTLDRFIKRQQSVMASASGELSQLLRDIALAGKIINREINRAGLVDITGAFGNQNIQGEDQQKLDVVADVRFLRALRNGGEVCAVITEEQDKIIYTDNDDGKYVVAIDPLDGSSNIDVNVSIGTIFSVYRRKTPTGTRATLEDARRTQPSCRRIYFIWLFNDFGLYYWARRECFYLRKFTRRIFSFAQ
jgi:fructose-1,6-bisphosphatase I